MRKFILSKTGLDVEVTRCWEQRRSLNSQILNAKFEIMPWRGAAVVTSLFSFFLCLFLLGGNALAATITWDGGGGNNSWHDPANWSGDVVPGSADDVVISVANANVTITNTTEVSGLTLAVGVRLTAQGAGNILTANGTTTVEGANLKAIQGASLNLPKVERFVNGVLTQSH